MYARSRLRARVRVIDSGKRGGWRRRKRKITEVELQGAGIRRGYVRGGSKAAGGVLEGKIRLLQPLTGQDARAHGAGLGSYPARKKMKARLFRG